MDEPTKSISKGQTTTVGYYVEARTTNSDDQLLRLGHTTITGNWRRVHWESERLEVPRGGILVRLPGAGFAEDHGILSYTAAVALMSTATSGLPLATRMCLRFRLQKLELVCEWSLTDRGVSSPLNFLEVERHEVFTLKEEVDERG